LSILEMTRQFGARAAHELSAGLGRLGRAVGSSPLAVYILAAVAGSLLLSICGLALAAAPVSPGSNEAVVFEVPPGAGTAAIAQDLEERGLIRDSLEFRVLAALLGWEGRLKAGRFEDPAEDRPGRGHHRSPHHP